MWPALLRMARMDGRTGKADSTDRTGRTDGHFLYISYVYTASVPAAVFRAAEMGFFPVVVAFWLAFFYIFL